MSSKRIPKRGGAHSSEPYSPSHPNEDDEERDVDGDVNEDLLDYEGDSNLE
jgi:hypothetical protein